jgi:hypothetical protein
LSSSATIRIFARNTARLIWRFTELPEPKR